MIKNHYPRLIKSEKAFTLIELLVVVAIIGILATVVIASLNGAREKGKIATIKSTLKQLYNQAALNQLEYGSFTGSTTSTTNLTCTGPGNNLAKIVQPLIDQGIYVKCQSLNGTSYGGAGSHYDGDNFLRFGATALIYDTGILKAWSVDENGVVRWDLKGVDSSGVTVTGNDVTMQWENISDVTIAMDACAKNGGKLPSIEEARTLSHAWYAATLALLGTGSYTPTPTSGGFKASGYWSSTPVPSLSTSLTYYQSMTGGDMNPEPQASSIYVRCVR